MRALEGNDQSEVEGSKKGVRQRLPALLILSPILPDTSTLVRSFSRYRSFDLCAYQSAR